MDEGRKGRVAGVAEVAGVAVAVQRDYRAACRGTLGGFNGIMMWRPATLFIADLHLNCSSEHARAHWMTRMTKKLHEENAAKSRKNDCNCASFAYDTRAFRCTSDEKPQIKFSQLSLAQCAAINRTSQRPECYLI